MGGASAKYCSMSYPDVEIKVLVSDRLDVKSYRWYRSDDFSYLYRVTTAS